jgi:periplasmic protein CpxP/Spy
MTEVEMIRLQTPLLAAALVTSVATVGLGPAMAQTAQGAANSASTQSETRHYGRMPGQFVEGRIAFLKTELKITPAQEAQWQSVAAAMRDNSKALNQTVAAMRQGHITINAVQRLELREQFAKTRADNTARLLAVFKPLYASLSPEQQQMADQLLLGQHHWHHRA